MVLVIPIRSPLFIFNPPCTAEIDSGSISFFLQPLTLCVWSVKPVNWRIAMVLVIPMRSPLFIFNPPCTAEIDSGSISLRIQW